MSLQQNEEEEEEEQEEQGLRNVAYSPMPLQHNEEEGEEGEEEEQEQKSLGDVAIPLLNLMSYPYFFLVYPSCVQCHLESVHKILASCSEIGDIVGVEEVVHLYHH